MALSLGLNKRKMTSRTLAPQGTRLHRQILPVRSNRSVCSHNHNHNHPVSSKHQNITLIPRAAPQARPSLGMHVQQSLHRTSPGRLVHPQARKFCQTKNNNTDVESEVELTPFSAFYGADTQKIQKASYGQNISEIMTALVEGNRRYKDKYKSEFAKFVKKDQPTFQTPQVSCLSCCDSRVSASSFGEYSSPNKVFTIRNIGNQTLTSEGSLKFAIFNLKTPVCVILGHTGCGAIRASNSDFGGENGALQRELITLLPSINWGNRLLDANVGKAIIGGKEKRPATLTLEERLDVLAEYNVDRQIDQLMKTDADVVNLVNQKKLILVGAMFDIHGRYCPDEYGSLMITNINGLQHVPESTLEALPELTETAFKSFQRLYTYKE